MAAAPGGNIIIGIDTESAKVKVMHVSGNTYSGATVETYKFDRKLMDAGDYVSILDSVFASYDQNALASNAISLVLPNNLIGFDFVGIPIMSKKNMADAVRVEFNALYKNNEALQMIPTPLVSSKKNALYILLIVNRAMINGMTQIFAGKKAAVRVKTFEANALVNSILQFRPKARRASFIAVDIKKNSTIMAVVNKERTVGYQNLPYGYSILSRKEVNTEFMLVDHDVAELAVINATELARKKKLTIDAAEAEELEEAERLAEEQRRQAEAEAEAEAQAKLEQSTENAENAEGAENAESTVEKTEEELAAEREQQALDAEFAEYNDEQKEEVKKPAVKVFTKKVPKALPMFMQRPIPESPEEFIAENFRIFEKRILLLKKHCDYDSIMPNPEFIVINMPNEYAFIIDRLNEDEDNGIEFRSFDPQNEEAPVVKENLELLGAMFAGTWNKQNNL
ncbi:MAG: hypothetical protein IJO93_01485 [Clostridia bacterium]|nr:hypothetical protein [Clostridia bacterium]